VLKIPNGVLPSHYSEKYEQILKSYSDYYQQIGAAFERKSYFNKAINQISFTVTEEQKFLLTISGMETNTICPNVELIKGNSITLEEVLKTLKSQHESIK